MTHPAWPNDAISDIDIDVLEARSPSLAVLPGDIPNNEKDWTLGDLVKVAAEKRVGVKRRLRELQDTCRNKRRKVPTSVAEAVGLAVELVDRGGVPPSPRMTSPRTPTIALESELNDARRSCVPLRIWFPIWRSPAMRRCSATRTL